MSSRFRVGVVALVLTISGCTAAATPASVPPTPSSAPSASTSQPAPTPHRFTSVSAFHANSPTFATASVDRCVRTGSTTSCRANLLLTEDGGRSWADVTPPDIPSGSALTSGSILTSVTFLDEDHGWATTADCVAGRGTLYRTLDGGRSWAGRSIGAPSCNAGAGIFPTFGDPLLGYLVHVEPSSGGPAEIARSDDGGRSWSRSRPLPFSGPAEFTSASEGWLVGDPFAGPPTLRRSLDGGRTWRRVRLPTSRRVASIGLPTFMGSSGVVPATIQRAHRWGVEFLTTDDGGSWQRAATVRFAGRAPNRLGVTGIAGPKTWWVANGNGTAVRTANAGVSWHRTSAPNGDPMVSLSPVDALRAWTLTQHGQRHRLWVTSDGGRSWRHVTPTARRRGPGSGEIRSVATLPGPPGDLAAGPDGSVYATYGRGHDQRAGPASRDSTPRPGPFGIPPGPFAVSRSPPPWSPSSSA